MSKVLTSKITWRAVTFLVIAGMVWVVLEWLASPSLGIIDDEAVANWLSEETPLQYLAEPLRKRIIGDLWRPVVAIAIAGFFSGLRAWIETSVVSRLEHPGFLRRVGEGNADTFVQRRMPLTAREPELGAMRAFLGNDTNFAWMWLLGRGRQGKTRLAVETCLAANSGRWSAAWRGADTGFVKADAGADDLNGWHPRRPTLLIIDPADGRAEQVESFVEHSQPGRPIFERRCAYS